MKYETHAHYEPRRTEMAQRAFLSVWSGFTRWHPDLVLLGGLIPRYICRSGGRSASLPQPATIDVDLGIALGTESVYTTPSPQHCQARVSCVTRRCPIGTKNKWLG